MGESPVQNRYQTAFSFLGDFCVSLPHPWRCFPPLMILGFFPCCVLQLSELRAEHLEPELVPLRVPCPTGSTAPSHAGYEDHLICGFSL